jgi:hypothetical protein
MISEEQFAQLLRNQAAASGKPLAEAQKPAKPRMNKWEALWAAELEQMKRDGAIRWYGFEAAKLRLADKTHYTPDFMVLWAGGLVEFQEVKGFWRDDARVKIKVAAELFPYQFTAITRERKTGEWQFEHFRARS